MIERRPGLQILRHVILLIGVAIVAFPLYLTFVGSTQTAQQINQSVPMSMVPGGHFWETYQLTLFGGPNSQGSPLPAMWPMMQISLISALGIAIGKIAISLLSAFAIVYFRFPLRNLVFWMIFVTLMLPVEVRISPTYEVVAGLGLLNSFAGLTVPLIASATATFLFRQFFLTVPLIASATATFLLRQFFLTVPDELVEAARIDGAGPMRFFRDVLLPLSATPMAALFVIQFIYGWNQYLWPLLVTTDESMYPIVLGIKRLIAGEVYTDWNIVMAVTLLAMLPPAVVVIGMQKWFVKGLVDTEK